MKVMIVDDHRLMREGLRALLEREQFEVIGEAENGAEAVTLAHDGAPDIVLMDISMPVLNGLEATRRIMSDRPNTKVIALSMNADRRYVVAMFEAGAVGYLLKNAATDELLIAIRAVAMGRKYISPAVADGLIEHVLEQARSAPPPERGLSPREREVLQLVAEGQSSKQIADHLGLAVPTVETHRRQIMEKLNLHSIAELTKYAVREGITSLD